MKDLEEKLGELSGILKSLAPMLERLEERVNDSQKQIATLENEIKNLQQDIASIMNENVDKNKNFAIFIYTALAAILGGIITYFAEKYSK
jgi:chromosome segregation ATPase